MKKITFSALCCLFLSVTYSQPSYYKTEPKWPEKDVDYKYYTVRGERHGVSFFKKQQWTNSGKLPVALEQAKRVKIVQEDRVMLDIDKELLKGNKNAKVIITSPILFDKTVYAGYTKPGEKKETTFKVKLNQKGPVKIKVKLMSTRGGYKEKEITIGS